MTTIHILPRSRVSWAPQKALVEAQAIVLQIEAYCFALPFADVRETRRLQRFCKSLWKYQEVRIQGSSSHCSGQHVGLDVS